MACYNSATKTVDLDYRTVFVKEEKIESRLSSDGGKPFSHEELSAVHSELERAEISPENIYKSGFFNIRFEQSLLKQPEDSVRIREMMRHIKRSAEELDLEYENYCKMRNKAKNYRRTKRLKAFCSAIYYFSITIILLEILLTNFILPRNLYIGANTAIPSQRLCSST